MPSVAADTPPESREYRISIDGTASGKLKLNIQPLADGSFNYTGQADLTVRILFRQYVYNFRGVENWKNGQLMRVESSANDNGKRFQLKVERENGALKLTNNSISVAPSASWTASHWHLPLAAKRGDITRIDPDTGKLIQGRVQFTGNEQISIAGRTIAAAHYRITGSNPAELWYDGDDRLLRQESTEDGHRMVIELIRLNR